MSLKMCLENVKTSFPWLSYQPFNAILQNFRILNSSNKDLDGFVIILMEYISIFRKQKYNKLLNTKKRGMGE